jgi:uroporphyrinogen decarboxylase
MLNDEVPLIGFAGSPWTIFFCYCVEGKGSKSFDTAKGFCFSQIQLQRIHIKKNHRYNYSIFKKRKVNQSNAVQIFDSWAECYLD